MKLRRVLSTSADNTSSICLILHIQKVKTYVICAWIIWIWSLSPSNHPRSDHAPIVIVIQSEHLKHSISPRNQSAKHPDSGCFAVSRVVIGSALSKGWRSGPEAFRAGHFLRLDRNRKPRMKEVSGSLGTFHTSRNLLEYIAFSIKTFRAAPFNLFLTARK